MSTLLGHPLFLFVTLLIVLPLASALGVYCLRRKGNLDEETLKDFGVVQAATLTLLGLLIGFSFSNAVGHYDQRKDTESEEANAIGTELLRVDLLTPANAAIARKELINYLDLRIEFYQIRDKEKLAQLDKETALSQARLWKVIQNETQLAITPVTSLVASGMNDVINTQGYTQAAWIKHFPPSAWILLIAISLICNILIGYGSHSKKGNKVYLFILPAIISIALTMVADIGSPRGGMIRIEPQNLQLLKASLPPAGV
ncbi:hypothetical protein MUA04_22540 [Enterobacteriaceae bacterium H11S18]|uniref:bestrophin-like domain n=1 Tax=Dryocola clanedunensis TaxID=2925396 RepID=UPI0022F140B8|nr:hypothetical protein [Dryocola clanedunensis]MCT4706201.1 hypothetical protein [Dryocola clanedunensis]MCT4712949.1 hypothetical protein [Dryocola clanedunensis]